MKNINFASSGWENDLEYTYSYRYNQRPVFVQKDGFIESSTDSTMPDGYDYITLMFKEKFKPGTKLTTKCWFHKYGAPIIMIANKIDFENGDAPLLIDYIEVVIWEKGINVWKHDVIDSKDTWFLMDSIEFKVENAAPVTFSAQIYAGKLVASCGSNVLEIETNLISDEVYMGIQACEGINRFYNVCVE